MEVIFDNNVFKRETEIAIRNQITRYINTTYGSLEQYYNGNKCAFSDNYSKVNYDIKDGEVVFRYKSAPFYCGKCYCKKLNPQSKEYLSKCCGYSDEEVIKKLSDKGKKSLETAIRTGAPSFSALAKIGKNPVSKETLLEKFDGDQDKVTTYLRNKSTKSSITKRDNGYYDDVSNNPFSKEYWKKRGLTEEEAQSKVNQRNFWCEESNSEFKNPGTIKYYIQKYGEINGPELFKEKQARSGYYRSLAGLIERYGEEEAKSRFYDLYSREGINASGSRSYEARHFFLRLYKRLRKAGYARQDIQFGANGSREYTIRDDNLKKYNRYDFCVISKKLIIEYNGSIWHPRKERLTEYQYTNWKMPWHPEISAEEKELKDLNKLKFAQDRGYDIIEIWDTDDKLTALQYCFDRITK